MKRVQLNYRSMRLLQDWCVKPDTKRAIESGAWALTEAATRAQNELGFVVTVGNMVRACDDMGLARPRRSSNGPGSVDKQLAALRADIDHLAGKIGIVLPSHQPPPAGGPQNSSPTRLPFTGR